MGFVSVAVAGTGLLVVLIEPHLDRYWLFVLAALLMTWIHIERAFPWKWTKGAVVWAVVCIV